MECFELIQSVLDEEYAQMAGTEMQKDAEIKLALEHLHDHYRCVSNAGPGDYRDRAARFAYIYCYTTAHANLVYQVIEHSSHLSKLFSKSSVEVACVGGGPGSDYLGVLKHLMLRRKKPKLRCSLFDREPAWVESWSDVDRKVEAAIQLSLQFITLDVTKPELWQPHTKYYRSDLFTFVYFLSEVVKYRTGATVYFDTLFKRAVPGSLFLFIDNNASEHYGWFDRMVRVNGFKTLRKTEGVMKMPWARGGEEKKNLGRYLEKFGNPKLASNVAVRIVEKTEGT
jgi:hypothetical protein